MISNLISNTKDEGLIEFHDKSAALTEREVLRIKFEARQQILKQLQRDLHKLGTEAEILSREVGDLSEKKLIGGTFEIESQIIGKYLADEVGLDLQLENFRKKLDEYRQKIKQIKIDLCNTNYDLSSIVNKNGVFNDNSLLKPKKAFKISAHSEFKYNTPKVIGIGFKEKKDLRILRDFYHTAPIPSFCFGLPFNIKGPDTSIYQVYPESFSATEDGTYILMLNPSYLPGYNSKSRTIKEEKGLIKLSELKNHEEGLVVTGWASFIEHPTKFKGLGKEAPIKKIPEYLPTTFEQAEREGGRKYLVSILDLTRDDLSWLQEIRAHTFEKLIKTYNVVPGIDQVKMYFHFPYLLSTAGLHLHVKVNSGEHPLSIQKSYDIDDVIKEIDLNGSVENLILERQQQNAIIGPKKQCLFISVPDKLAAFLSKEGEEKQAGGVLMVDEKLINSASSGMLKDFARPIAQGAKIEILFADNPFYCEKEK